MPKCRASSLFFSPFFPSSNSVLKKSHNKNFSGGTRSVKISAAASQHFPTDTEKKKKKRFSSESSHSQLQHHQDFGGSWALSASYFCISGSSVRHPEHREHRSDDHLWHGCSDLSSTTRTPLAAPSITSSGQHSCSDFFSPPKHQYQLAFFKHCHPFQSISFFIISVSFCWEIGVYFTVWSVKRRTAPRNNFLSLATYICLLEQNVHNHPSKRLTVLMHHHSLGIS